MKKIAAITAIILLSVIHLQAQTTLWEENLLDGRNFPFYTNGFYKISTEFADIDSDGDKDCFIGSNEGISFFKNMGDSVSPIWKLITKEFLDIEFGISDRMKVRLVDIDSDGDLDMFIGGSSQAPLVFYRNTGSEFEAQWEPVADFLNDLESESLLKFCYPAFVDIDNDEDYDLIYGNYYGDDFLYENTGDKYNYNFTNRGPGFFGLSKHWNNHNIDFHDIDNDSDLDALIGTHYELMLMINTGSADSAAWQCDTSRFFGISKYNCGVYFSPTFTDVPDSKCLDLVVGTEEGTLWNYDTVQERWKKDNSMYFDEGGEMNPEFADINGDGLKELVIPVFRAPQDSSFLRIYQNTGNADSVVWELSSDRLEIDFPFPLNRATFADVDGDGDLDLISGFKDNNRDILLYMNTGDKHHPDFSTGQETIATFREDNLVHFYPNLIDFDGDQDFDLIVSAQSAIVGAYEWVDFFENAGNVSNYHWEYSHTERHGFGANGCIDDDGDGDQDLMFTWRNLVSVVYNTGTLNNPVFEPLHHQKIEPSVSVSGFAYADLSNDGKPDLILGTNDGGILRYDNQGLSQVMGTDSKSVVKLFPNPASDQISISGLAPDLRTYQLYIYDSSGELVYNNSINNNTQVSIRMLVSGNYLYKILYEYTIIDIGKIVVIK